MKTQFRFTSTRIAAFGFVLCGIAGVWAWFYFASPFVEINDRYRHYEAITQEMTQADVVFQMGPPDRVRAKPISPGPFWDMEIRDDVSADDVDQVAHYSTTTFFLPVTFEFTFNADGRIVGKHVYD